MMAKVYIFNKSNNLLRVCNFKTVYQCIDSEISLTHCTEMSAVYQNMVNSKGIQPAKKPVATVLRDSPLVTQPNTE